MAEEKKPETKVRRPSAKKRDIQSTKRRLHNREFKSRINTTIKSFESHLTQKDEKGAIDRLNQVYSLLDKAVKTHVFKLNKANRLKSTLAKHLTKLSA